MEYIIKEPYEREAFMKLKAGDSVLLSGTVYTARDAAHKRLADMLNRGQKLPFDIKDSIIFYVGPTPPKPGYPIGSAGPTSSYRMDSFAPALMKAGLLGMIGKGPRNEIVRACIKETGAVYFAAVGGAAALLAQSVKAAELLAFEDLGTEAIRKLTVENMPLIVANDVQGGDIYER